EQLRARGVIEVVRVEVLRERLELAQRALGAGDVPHGDRAIEAYHRRVTEVEQSVVDLHDVRPAGLLPRRRVGVRERYERLQLVRAGPADRQEARDDRDAVVDRVAVPLPALLVL